MDSIKLGVLIAVVFIVGFAVGMVSENLLLSPSFTTDTTDNQNNNDIVQSENKALFIGTWEAVEDSSNQNVTGTVYYTWSFFENDTAKLETTLVNETMDDSISTWRDYQIMDDKVLFELPQGNDVEYMYSFSDGDNKVTFTQQQSNAALTFTKQ